MPAPQLLLEDIYTSILSVEAKADQRVASSALNMASAATSASWTYAQTAAALPEPPPSQSRLAAQAPKPTKAKAPPPPRMPWLSSLPSMTIEPSQQRPPGATPQASMLHTTTGWRKSPSSTSLPRTTPMKHSALPGLRIPF